jgi:hypothetical protein
MITIDVALIEPSSALLLCVMAAVAALACVTQYAAIGTVGFGPLAWRAYAAGGWTLLVVRLASVWWTGAEPTLPPIAAIAVVLIGAGATLRNVADSSCRPFANFAHHDAARGDRRTSDV